jgi:hypothetical protein
MTPQRMLRLTDDSADWLKDVLEEVYAGEHGPIPKDFYACALIIKGRLELEPAPVEGWVPACIGGIKYRIEPECEECIFKTECKGSD